MLDLQHGLLLLFGQAVMSVLQADSQADEWWLKFSERLPFIGHRNWIAIVDSAYPAQSSQGITTLISGADQIEVLTSVLEAIKRSIHVRPLIYIDSELEYVGEADAPGVTQYRSALQTAIGGERVWRLQHEEIIQRLDSAGKTFEILIIKTNFTVPYTSVFLELDCKYWSEAAEKNLRETIENASRGTLAGP